jgi:V8-like Glu-specific endopeptidase
MEWISNDREKLLPASTDFGKTDNRSIILDPKARGTPWRWICSLKCSFLRRGVPITISGTGFLVGPRVVLTAAHLMYGEGYGWVKTAIVTPCGILQPYGHSLVQAPGSFITNKEWVNSGGAQTPLEGPTYDYGAIILPQSFGDNFNYFTVSSGHSDKDYESIEVFLAGYPSDKVPFGTLWSDNGKISAVDTTQLHYKLGDATGDSGSPLFYQDNDGNYSVLGIHTQAWRDANHNIVESTATRITHEILEGVNDLNKKYT